MIEPEHLLTEVIRPVLRHLGMHSQDAERLMLGTAFVESMCGRYLKQLGGPAIGIYQMEPATHEDIWDHWLLFREPVRTKVNYWRVRYSNGAGAEEMAGNLYYATAMARLQYYRRPEPLPTALYEQAAYWKQWYNTPAGRGSVEKYVLAWYQFSGAGGTYG